MLLLFLIMAGAIIYVNYQNKEKTKYVPDTIEDKDNITYLDESKPVNMKSANTNTNTKPVNVSGKSANAKQNSKQKSNDVAVPAEKKVQQENTIPSYTEQSIQTESTPEYQADYGKGDVEYNYVAEYPDTSHIWDDLNPELFPNTHDMKLCPSCGTENIIVRDSSGKCHCFYCQAELS